MRSSNIFSGHTLPHPQTWPDNRGDKLQWGHKVEHEAMAANFNPGRPYLKLRRLEEEEGSLNIFPRWEVYDHEGRHRAWWIKNNMEVQRLKVWIAVDFDAAKCERTLCPTDLVVEQGAYATGVCPGRAGSDAGREAPGSRAAAARRR